MKRFLSTMCPYMPRKGVFPSIVFVALITLKTVGCLRLSCHYIFLEHVLVMFTIMDHCWLYKDRCHLYSHDVEGDLKSTVACIKASVPI